MHHDVQARQEPSLRPPPENLAHASLGALPDDRIANLAARGDPKAGIALFVLMDMKACQRAMKLATLAIASQIIHPTLQFLLTLQPFVSEPIATRAAFYSYHLSACHSSSAGIRLSPCSSGTYQLPFRVSAKHKGACVLCGVGAR